MIGYSGLDERDEKMNCHAEDKDYHTFATVAFCKGLDER